MNELFWDKMFNIEPLDSNSEFVDTFNFNSGYFNLSIPSELYNYSSASYFKNTYASNMEQLSINISITIDTSLELIDVTLVGSNKKCYPAIIDKVDWSKNGF